MAANRRDLFINIGGSASELSAATKAGRTALLELSQSTGSIVDQISANMQKIGASATAPLAELDRNFKSSLKSIRDEMRSLSASGDQGAMLKFFDQNSINQQIAQGERLSVQYRKIADAAQDVARGGGANSEAAKVWAASYGTLAAQTELETEKLRDQARAQAEVLGHIDGQIDGGKRITNSAGQQKAAMQQLSFQIGDVAQGFAAGTKPAVIFAQQSGQVIQALQLMIGAGEGWVGTVGKFAPFVGAALVVLTPFIAKLFESNNALTDGIDKLKKSAAETEAARRATVAYNSTIEGEIELQKKLNDELDRSIRTQRQVNQNKLLAAQQNVANLQADRPGLAAQIAAQERAVAQLRNVPGGNDPFGQGLVALADAQARLAALKAQLAATDQSIAAGLRGIREAQVPLIQNDVEAQLDANAAAARRYEIALGNLNQQLAIGAGNKAKKQFYLPDGTFDTREISGISASEYQRQLAIISARKKAEEKAASDAKKTQPSGSPSSALLSSAESYRGASESSTSGRAILKTLFDQAGISIDPKMVAWCAAFVNAVLATNGLPGTGSLSAKSFLDYGAKTDAPQKGDIVVSKREGGGHVGFFEGFDKSGNVRVLGGNTGDKVGEQTIKRSDVLGFRRAPASGQSAEDVAAKAAQKEAERRASFERELGDEQAKVLVLSRELTVAEDDRLDVKLATIAAEKDNRDNALDNLVTTGKLTKAEADQLKSINARIADEKAAIATNRSIIETRRKVLEADRAEYQAKAALLNLQGELATTNKQRLKIARELLDLEFKQRREEAEAKIASHDPNVAAEGKLDLRRINAEEPLRKRQTDKQYAGPLERYRDQLKAATDDMDEALQGVAVHGLQTLEDGLLGVIDGTETVAGAFKKMALSILADLARIAIEKAIVGAIGKSFFGFAEGHIGGPGGSAIHGFASGIISGPGTGTSDSIPGWMAGVGPIYVSNGESIMTAEATRQFGPILKAMNDNSVRGFAAGDIPSFPSLPSAGSLRNAGGQSGPIQVNVTLSDDLHATIDNRAANVSVEVFKAGAPTMVQAATRNTIATLGRPGL